MMKSKLSPIAIVGIIFLAIFSFCGIIYTAIFISSSIIEKQNRSRCTPLPEGFSQSELIGTWVAGSPKHSDTLIIRANGTYKQIVHVELSESPPINYISDWQSWHLQRSEGNITYIYLEGMRFCGMNPEIPCQERNSGGYDFCTDKYIDMNNEGILIVLAADSDQLPGTNVPKYYLHLDYPLGSENSWSYSLQGH
jgi:hypothetical protein